MCLGHIDREVAKAKGRRDRASVSKAEPAQPAALTLATRFDTYERDVTHEKGESKRA